MLQDLVLAAVNEAGRKVDEAIQEKVGGPHRRDEAAGDVVPARAVGAGRGSASRVVEDEQVGQPGAAQHERRVLRVEPHPGVEPRRGGLDRAEVGDLLPPRLADPEPVDRAIVEREAVERPAVARPGRVPQVRRLGEVFPALRSAGGRASSPATTPARRGRARPGRTSAPSSPPSPAGSRRAGTRGRPSTPPPRPPAGCPRRWCPRRASTGPTPGCRGGRRRPRASLPRARRCGRRRARGPPPCRPRTRGGGCRATT